MKRSILLLRIVQFGEAVRAFHAVDEEFETFGDCRIAGDAFDNGEIGFGKIVDQRWLNKIVFDVFLE